MRTCETNDRQATYLLSELKGASMSTNVTSSPPCWSTIGDDGPPDWAKWDRWARCGGSWKDRTGNEDSGRPLAGDDGPPAIRLKAGEGTRDASSTSTFGSAIMAASNKLPVRLLLKVMLNRVTAEACAEDTCWDGHPELGEPGGMSSCCLVNSQIAPDCAHCTSLGLRRCLACWGLEKLRSC